MKTSAIFTAIISFGIASAIPVDLAIDDVPSEGAELQLPDGFLVNVPKGTAGLGDNNKALRFLGHRNSDKPNFIGLTQDPGPDGLDTPFFLMPESDGPGPLSFGPDQPLFPSRKGVPMLRSGFLYYGEVKEAQRQGHYVLTDGFEVEWEEKKEGKMQMGKLGFDGKFDNAWFWCKQDDVAQYMIHFGPIREGEHVGHCGDKGFNLEALRVEAGPALAVPVDDPTPQ